MQVTAFDSQRPGEFLVRFHVVVEYHFDVALHIHRPDGAADRDRAHSVTVDEQNAVLGWMPDEPLDRVLAFGPLVVDQGAQLAAIGPGDPQAGLDLELQEVFFLRLSNFLGTDSSFFWVFSVSWSMSKPQPLKIPNS